MAMLSKLIRGLSRTKNRFVNTLRSALTGRAIDRALLDDLEAILIEADLGVHSVEKMSADLEGAAKSGQVASGDQVIEFLKDEMKTYWPESDRTIHFAETGPTVILVAGVNGTGKTTSVAKLAYQFHCEGKKVLLAAADTYRAAAQEQLGVWADRIGCDLITGSGNDPASVAYDACDAAIARDADVLLIDTAGRLHTQKDLMRELAKIRNVVQKKLPGAPHEVLLVLDATTGQNAISQAKSFMETIDVTGIMLAKLDGTARGGIVVAIRNQISLPVKFVGLGESYEDIEPFDPERFVEALFA